MAQSMYYESIFLKNILAQIIANIIINMCNVNLSMHMAFFYSLKLSLIRVRVLEESLRK